MKMLFLAKNPLKPKKMKNLNELQKVQFEIISKYKNDFIKLQSMYNEHKHLRQIIKKISNKQIKKIIPKT